MKQNAIPNNNIRKAIKCSSKQKHGGANAACNPIIITNIYIGKKLYGKNDTDTSRNPAI